MPDGCENSGSTVVFSTGLPWRGTGVCVVAAGWPTIFTTYMGGVGGLVTGGSITAACGVFAEDVTYISERNDPRRLDIERMEDDD